MTNFNVLSKEERKSSINHKYEYSLKQNIFDYWRHRDITGALKALKRMEKDFNLLKQYNPKSEYISKCEDYILKCKIENLKDCKDWINERLQYIAENCDLNDKDNKRAFESLKMALECVEKMEV